MPPFQGRGTACGGGLPLEPMNVLDSFSRASRHPSVSFADSSLQREPITRFNIHRFDPERSRPFPTNYQPCYE